MMALYCALIVGLLVLLWRGFDVLWIYALLGAMGTVELSFRSSTGCFAGGTGSSPSKLRPPRNWCSDRPRSVLL
jgi:hypothetical protein